MSDDLNRRRGSVPYAYPASHNGYSAYSRETYKGAELDYRGRPPRPQTPDGEAMRATTIAIAITLVALLAAMLYHLKTVDRLTADLQAEIGAHAVTRKQLTACQSSSRAACAVQAAKDGKADAGQLLENLIKERRR